MAAVSLRIFLKVFSWGISVVTLLITSAKVFSPQFYSIQLVLLAVFCLLLVMASGLVTVMVFLLRLWSTGRVCAAFVVITACGIFRDQDAMCGPCTRRWIRNQWIPREVLLLN